MLLATMRRNNNSPRAGSATTTTRLLLLLLVCCTCCWVSVDAKRKSKPNSTLTFTSVDHTTTTIADDDIPTVHFLVEWMGQEIYAMVKKPKYKFYIYMTIGTLPNEQNTIVLLSTLCNVLYGISILFGFLLLPRGPMLFATLATLWIGPALVLMLLGSIGVAVAAFALYPIVSVASMCLWFFLTSQLAQTIGKRWGLDSDEDGDVDWLDLLHGLARTDLGTSVGLMRLHEVLNQANQDPFQEIHHRLSIIDQNTKLHNGTIAGSAQQQVTPDTKKNG